MPLELLYLSIVDDSVAADHASEFPMIVEFPAFPILFGREMLYWDDGHLALLTTRRFELALQPLLVSNLLEILNLS